MPIFDDSQSTNSTEFTFSNSSRIWSSSGISSSLPTTSSKNDREKNLILNHSASTTTTSGSGSPYYHSGLFSSLPNLSPTSPTNIDNNVLGGNTNNNITGNKNGSAPSTLNVHLPLNLNVRTPTSTSTANNASLDRVNPGKFSTSLNSSSTLNSLNFDKLNVSSSGSINNNNNNNSYGHQGYMNAANPNVNPHGLAHPQLHPHQHHDIHVDHQQQYAHGHLQGQHQSHNAPHSQLQPRHQHQHPDHLTSAMQGMHMSSSRGHGHNAMHANMDPLEEVLGPFPCVGLRNLPYDINLQEVLTLLQGLVLLDVVIMPNAAFSHGQNQVAEAYVLFATPLESSMALQRSGLYIRSGVQIEIFQGKRSDYYSAISSVRARAMRGDEHQHSHGHGQHHPHMSDLGHPPPHQHQDSQGTSWKGAGYVAGTGGSMHGHMSMHQGQGSRGGAQGQGQGNIGNTNYKASQAGAGASFAQMNKGSSARSGRGEGRSKGSGGRGNGRGGGIQVGEHTGYLRMRGLPFSTTKKEIFDFFKSYNPVEDSICLTYRSDGRATGEGYILFATAEHAKDAMTLHRNSMGSRYIELFISNKEEHGRAQAREPSEE